MTTATFKDQAAKSVLILLVVLAGSLPTVASEYKLHINVAALSEILGDRAITAVTQDESGYLWIATQQGVFRFDGNQATNFNYSNGSKHWLPNGDVTGIDIDSYGRIWVSTYGGGLARYNPWSDSFESPFGKQSNTPEFLTAILFSADGDLWLGSRNHGISLLGEGVRQPHKWVLDDEQNKKIRGVNELIEDQEGLLWVASNSGLFRVNSTAKSIEQVSLPFDSLNDSSQITALEALPDNKLLIGTAEGKLALLDMGVLRFIAIDQLSGYAMGAILDFEAYENRIWIATDSGLISLSNDLTRFVRYTSNESNLANNHITALHATRGMLWIGTYNGLSHATTSIFNRYTSTNGSLLDEVLSFTTEDNGNVWVGTYSGLFHYDTATDEHLNIEAYLPETKLKDHRVMALAIRREALWIGFRQNGFQVINTRSGLDIPLEGRSPENLPVTNILHLSTGQTLIGTYDRGLLVYDGPSLQRWLSNLDSHAIMALLEIQPGIVFIGMDHNSYLLDMNTFSLTPVLFNLNGESVALTVYSAVKMPSGEVLIGSKNQGLFKWRPNTSTNTTEANLITPSISEALGPTIYGVQIDDHNHIWVSTTDGIFRVTETMADARRYTIADGIQGKDFNYGASHKDHQGKIYFGGSNGYNRIDPTDAEEKHTPPPVVLTELIIAGKDSEFPHSLETLESIELSHSDYYITFIFSVLDFRDPANNTFSYKLEGFDPEWINNRTRNSATYTNLPPGEYTMRIRGASSAAVWNMEGISIELIVHPPLWRTWWAYTLYGLAALGLFLFVKKIYDDHREKEHATAMMMEMREVANHSMDDLQEQLDIQEEMMRSVHQYSSDLTRLIGTLLESQSGFVEERLGLDAIDANLERMEVLKLLERCLYYDGDVLRANLEQYTDLLLSHLLPRCPAPPESIITVNDVNGSLLPADLSAALAIILFELVHNALVHGLDGSEPANYLTITLQEASVHSEKGEPKAELRLTVKDSGVGLPPNMSMDNPHTMGFSIINDLSRSLGGKASLSSANGTLATVSIPGRPNFSSPYTNIKSIAEMS